jgi:GNAT superfamily N-acetyltransferase
VARGLQGGAAYDHGIEVHPLTPDRWRDFVDLFERPGPRGGRGIASNGCWCMWWRRHRDHAQNRRSMQALVRGGDEPGLLAYDGGVAVGWISVAPKQELGTLARSRRYGGDADNDRVWAIVCFYVHANARHRGVAAVLLRAALEYARERGARVVEAYPHDRRPDYMGSRELFERQGFKPFREAEPRTVMRRRLSGRRPTARRRDRAAP